MRKIWSRKIFVITLGIIVVSVLLFFIFQIEKPSVVHSGIKDNINIRGWMWSSSDRGYPGGIGWISLNCYNDYNNDGVPENCCPNGRDCPHQPARGNYGLKLENNKISGYAWSPNVGWLCFGETCQATAPDGQPAWACLGESATNGICAGEGKFVFGWAKVMWSNQLNDGWIKLRDQIYSLSLEKFSTHSELQGFAWSHSYNPQISKAGLGWLAPRYGCLSKLPGDINEFEVMSLSGNCHSLALKWQAATCAQRYKIYRYYGEEVRLIEVIASDFCSTLTGECSYEDQGLLPNRVYRYQIQAWNLNGDGPISVLREGTTVPCPPQLPSPPCQAIDSSKCGEIKITWQKVIDTDPEITIKYNVYRSLQPNGCPGEKCRKLTSSPRDCQETDCGEISSSFCFYTDKQILANVDYYYWVSAVSEAGESSLTSMGRGKSVCLPTTQWQEQ